MTRPASHPSGAELVARLAFSMKKHGGRVVTYVVSGHSAWVVVQTANRRVSVAHITSRPAGCAEPELVTSCEPFAEASECPVTLAIAAWMLETDPVAVPSDVRNWRRKVALREVSHAR